MGKEKKKVGRVCGRKDREKIIPSMSEEKRSTPYFITAIGLGVTRGAFDLQLDREKEEGRGG